MDKDVLIKKWLNNELSEAEEKAFKQLGDYDFNQYILDNAKHFKASNFSKIDDFETFKDNYNSQNIKVRKLNWKKPMLRIASVIVIALGIYSLFFLDNTTKIQTLASEKTTIELPDNSKVSLNALSSIEFNKNKWNENRMLKLNGEAYFRVAKGKQFDVITTDGKVTVVGTEFNVIQRDNYFEVKCYEGVVRVSSDTIIRRLIAGDTYKIFDGKFTESKTTSSQPQWTKESSIFNAMPIKEVIAELERQYNIKVILKEVNANRLFTGGFTHKNLENALISITQPMNMTYEFDSSKHIIINGQKE